MKIAVISFVVMFLNINFSNVFAEKLNNTFRVDKQSEGYRLGWNLSWAEKCNYYGYYNKFWKLYKKILATNNPQFEGVKQGWSYGNRADESTGCSEKVLKQLLTNTENLLNNPHNEKSLNTGLTNPISYKTPAELCFAIENNRGTQWEKRFQNEANKRNINCEEVTNSAEEICLYAYNKITDNWSTLFSARKYVEKAKKLGVSCKPKDQEDLKNESSKNKNKIQIKENVILNSNKITNKTKDAENKCTEIGFTKGTEKYGDCVLKMLELK